LAKKEEEIFLPGRSESVRLPRRSPALRMLQQARDEAHRFAVSFQRQKRAARTITSELLRIPGIGPNKRRALLHVFGSVQGVKEASVEAIAQVPGFGETSARKVLASLGVEALPSSGSAVAVSPDSEVPLSESPVPPPVSLPSSPEPYA
jgi:excinuclease ABC subunit C